MNVNNVVGSCASVFFAGINYVGSSNLNLSFSNLGSDSHVSNTSRYRFVGRSLLASTFVAATFSSVIHIEQLKNSNTRREAVLQVLRDVLGSSTGTALGLMASLGNVRALQGHGFSIALGSSVLLAIGLNLLAAQSE